MIEFWRKNGDYYGLSLREMPNEANKISKLLKGYYSERIKDDDVPVFYFHKKYLVPIQHILKKTLKSQEI